MYVMTIIRTFCMTCVPLFLLLTGYLCSRRELTKGYYRKLLPILQTYLLSACLIVCYRAYVGKESFSVQNILFYILDIETVGYAWYINMYIGLFMLMPFLNILYQGLQTQKMKTYFILVMLILTMAPSMLNTYVWFDVGFLRKPAAYWPYQRIFPDWWEDIWPLTYYFLGAYIREYGVNTSKKWRGILLVLSLIASGTYIFYRSFGFAGFVSFAWSWGTACTVIPSTLLFVWLYGLDLSRLPKGIEWIVFRSSKLSLGIYLCSYVSDNLLYPIFNNMLPCMQLRYVLMPVVVLASFGMATVMSQLIDWILSAPKWIKNHVH